MVPGRELALVNFLGISYALERRIKVSAACPVLGESSTRRMSQASE